VAENWKPDADKIAFRAHSILAQLSDQEFEKGLAAARQCAAAARIVISSCKQRVGAFAISAAGNNGR
jgi:hypothetical protein